MRDKELEKYWMELEDVLFVEDNESDSSFKELVLNEKWLHFEKGTDRESIWHWFDENHSKGVGWLMYEFEGE